MLETPHVAVAAAIAVKSSNPLLAISLSFLSHFALELVPHWNPHLNTEIKKHGTLTKQTKNIIKADTTISLALGLLISSNYLSNDINKAILVLMCCFSAVIPDLLEAPYYLFKSESKIVKKWIVFKKTFQNDTTLFFGTLTQLAIILASLYWIYFL